MYIAFSLDRSTDVSAAQWLRASQPPGSSGINDFERPMGCASLPPQYSVKLGVRTSVSGSGSGMAREMVRCCYVSDLVQKSSHIRSRPDHPCFSCAHRAKSKEKAQTIA